MRTDAPDMAGADGGILAARAEKTYFVERSGSRFATGTHETLYYQYHVCSSLENVPAQ